MMMSLPFRTANARADPSSDVPERAETADNLEESTRNESHVPANEATGQLEDAPSGEAPEPLTDERRKGLEQELNAAREQAQSLETHENYDLAAAAWDEAAALSSQLHGAASNPTLDQQEAKAGMWAAAGRDAEAAEAYKAALQTARGVCGERSTRTIGLLEELGLTLEKKHLYAEGLPLFQEAFDKALQLCGEHHDLTINAARGLGSCMLETGSQEAALEMYRDARRMSIAHYGTEAETAASAAQGLAITLCRLQRYDESIPYWGENLAYHRRARGDEDTTTILQAKHLGTAQHLAKQRTEAEATLREWLPRSARVNGEDDDATLAILDTLGTGLFWQGKHEEGKAHKLEEARVVRADLVARHERVHGPDSPRVIANQGMLAETLSHQLRWHEAAAVRESRHAKLCRVHGADAAEPIAERILLAATLGKDGQADAAAVHGQAAYQACRRVFGDADERTASAAVDVCDYLGNQAWLRGSAAEANDPVRVSAALQHHRAYVEVATRRFGPEEPETVEAMMWLGDVMNESDEDVDAFTTHWTAARALCLRVHGPAHLHSIKATVALSKCYELGGRLDEAAALWEAVRCLGVELQSEDGLLVDLADEMLEQIDRLAETAAAEKDAAGSPRA